MNNKPLFHEAPQSEIQALIDGGKPWGDIMESYRQPDWCTYHKALEGTMGCWVLVTRGFRREWNENQDILRLL